MRTGRADAPELRLALLGGFELRRRGEPVRLPLAEQRLVAFLALHDHRVQRVFVAGNLWAQASDARARAALRTTLWRLRREVAGLVWPDGRTLALSPSVTIDVVDATARATNVIEHPDVHRRADVRVLAVAGEVLPDWYDDWVLAQRERFHQIRLDALEALCCRLAEQQRFAEAKTAGLAAVAGDPLRESAQRALISTYLAEGNPSEALREYRSFRWRLADQLGLEPSDRLEALLAELRPARADPTEPSPRG